MSDKILFTEKSNLFDTAIHIVTKRHAKLNEYVIHDCCVLCHLGILTLLIKRYQ